MATFTVIRKGEEIEFDSVCVELNAARDYLYEHLSHNQFAMDLASKNKLSEKQIAWIHYLVTQHVIESEQEQTEPNGQFLELVNKMYSGVKSKGRKFTVRLPFVTISTVTKGVNEGHLYVFDENNQYAGKITPRGKFIGDVSDDVLNMLEDANENLLELARLYGHETGQCSICARTLSDPLSVQMGIGPQCMKRLQ